MTKEKKPPEEKKEANIKEPTFNNIVRQLEECNREKEEYQKLKEEYLIGWKRERADFLNYKKDEMERIGQLIKYANEELILKILPILDNFEVAAKNIPENLKNDENPEGKPPASYGASIKGLLQINQQIKDFLKSQGVEEIQCLGKKFDPNFMEAVEDVEKEDKESGIVIEEVQKGYIMYGRVIRPAKVRVTS